MSEFSKKFELKKVAFTSWTLYVPHDKIDELVGFLKLMMGDELKTLEANGINSLRVTPDYYYDHNDNSRIPQKKRYWVLYYQGQTYQCSYRNLAEFFDWDFNSIEEET